MPSLQPKNPLLADAFQIKQFVALRYACLVRCEKMILILRIITLPPIFSSCLCFHHPNVEIGRQVIWGHSNVYLCG